MLRVLIVLAVALFPTILFAAFAIWMIGSLGYAPLQPLAATIQHIVEPFIEPIKMTLANLFNRLFGR